jgi:hypothetical protein
MTSDSYDESGIQEVYVGQEVNGSVLVCRGDDWPDEFVSWLEPLATEFNRILMQAEEFGITLKAPKSRNQLVSITDFCSEISIDFDSEFWEGDHISGIYKMGWLGSSQQENAERKGEQLVDTLSKKLEKEIRSEILSTLKDAEDLDEFLSLSANYRLGLTNQIKSLQSQLGEKEQRISFLENSIGDLNIQLERNSSQIESACVELASAVLEGKVTRIVAGPLVLWDDGNVYAITSRGKVDLPEGSAPKLLIESLKKSGTTVVEVEEMTVIGGWITGPKYARGDSHVSGWKSVWSEDLRKERNFIVEPKEFEQKVFEICEQLTQGEKS